MSPSPSQDKQLTDNIAITVLLGLLGLIIVGVYNTAFKKGFFTCQHYVFNTYLYILMALVIICLEVLAFDLHNLDFSKYLGSIMSFVILLAVVWFAMSKHENQSRNVILKFSLTVFVTVVSFCLSIYLKSGF